MNVLRPSRTHVQRTVSVLAGVGLIILLLNASGLLPRLITAAQPQPTRPKMTATDSDINRLERLVAEKPDDLQTRIALAGDYIQKVRETADTSYYAKVDGLLAKVSPGDAANDEVLSIRGSLANGRHDFAASLALSQQAAARNPHRAAYFGQVGDAQIELGQYAAAAASFQTMVNLKPDLSSYSRVAYIRELYGDVSGAETAFQTAISAGSPFIENVAFNQTELGKLYLRTDLTKAEEAFSQALHTVPDYPPALEGLGRVAFAQDKRSRAEDYFKKAYAVLPTALNAINLGDFYAAEGDASKADQQYQLAELAYAKSAPDGVNNDLEHALFLAEHDRDLPKALAQATAAYAQRPSINGADALAWNLYKSGRYVEAAVQIKPALQLGENDPLVLYHAGLIAARNNDQTAAKHYLSRALELNPHFGLLQPQIARDTLGKL